MSKRGDTKTILQLIQLVSNANSVIIRHVPGVSVDGYEVTVYLDLHRHSHYEGATLSEAINRAWSGKE